MLYSMPIREREKMINDNRLYYENTFSLDAFATGYISLLEEMLK